MSRIEIQGKTYDIAVGVDHVTSVFLQIWKKPADEQDGCFLKIEGKNLVADEDSDEYKGLPNRALNYIKDCVARMQKGEGDYLSAEHICLILQTLDTYENFQGVKSSVYRVLD